MRGQYTRDPGHLHSAPLWTEKRGRFNSFQDACRFLSLTFFLELNIHKKIVKLKSVQLDDFAQAEHVCGASAQIKQQRLSSAQSPSGHLHSLAPELS